MALSARLLLLLRLQKARAEVLIRDYLGNGSYPRRRYTTVLGDLTVYSAKR
jgi:hypothetical protein